MRPDCKSGRAEGMKLLHFVTGLQIRTGTPASATDDDPNTFHHLNFKVFPALGWVSAESLFILYSFFNLIP